MFAKLIAAPFVILALLFLYLAWEVDSDYAPYMVPFLVLSALVFVLGPQINWWWYTRHPPVMDEKLTILLERFNGFYQNLPAADKKRFRDRIGLFQMGTDWTPVGFPEDTMSPDLQMALAAPAVMLGFRKPEVLFGKFEKVIVYPLPFPSPEYAFEHASELYVEDACLLFSSEQVMQAFIEPHRLYNVALHEYARVFVLCYPNEPYPAFEDDNVWEKLQTVSGMSRQFVENVIGLSDVEALPVAIHHFFIFRERFEAVFPGETANFRQIFLSNKSLEQSPGNHAA